MCSEWQWKGQGEEVNGHWYREFPAKGCCDESNGDYRLRRSDIKDKRCGKYAKKNWKIKKQALEAPLLISMNKDKQNFCCRRTCVRSAKCL
eukprot:6491288-Amphidinium_carterae.5